jgi:hypothetical protein
MSKFKTLLEIIKLRKKNENGINLEIHYKYRFKKDIIIMSFDDLSCDLYILSNIWKHITNKQEIGVFFAGNKNCAKLKILLPRLAKSKK